MRSQHHQQQLNALSYHEKVARTSYEAMLARGVIVKKYKFRHLARNEMPNNVGGEELVLRHSGDCVILDHIWAEYGRIRQEYSNHKFIDNAIQDKSVPGRYHVHVLYMV